MRSFSYSFRKRKRYLTFFWDKPTLFWLLTASALWISPLILLYKSELFWPAQKQIWSRINDCNVSIDKSLFIFSAKNNDESYLSSTYPNYAFHKTFGVQSLRTGSLNVHKAQSFIIQPYKDAGSYHTHSINFDIQTTHDTNNPIFGVSFMIPIVCLIKPLERPSFTIHGLVSYQTGSSSGNNLLKSEMLLKLVQKEKLSSFIDIESYSIQSSPIFELDEISGYQKPLKIIAQRTYSKNTTFTLKTTNEFWSGKSDSQNIFSASFKFILGSQLLTYETTLFYRLKWAIITYSYIWVIVKWLVRWIRDQFFEKVFRCIISQKYKLRIETDTIKSLF